MKASSLGFPAPKTAVTEGTVGDGGTVVLWACGQHGRKKPKGGAGAQPLTQAPLASPSRKPHHQCVRGQWERDVSGGSGWREQNGGRRTLPAGYGQLSDHSGEGVSFAHPALFPSAPPVRLRNQ